MIVDSSRCWEVFHIYRHAFGESRIKVVWFEEYTADPTRVFQEVCRFVGIDDSIAPDFTREHTNSRDNALLRMARIGRGNVAVNPTWDEDVRQRVISQIREDNLQFLAHFGKAPNHRGELF